MKLLFIKECNYFYGLKVVDGIGLFVAVTVALQPLTSNEASLVNTKYIAEAVPCKVCPAICVPENVPKVGELSVGPS